MSKAKSSFVCQACGTSYAKWTGRCDACGEWDTVVEENQEGSGAYPIKKTKSSKIELLGLSGHEAEKPRIPSGVAEFDRVLGGGFVEGSAILIGGDPGIGKSTLLLQVAANVSTTIKVAYITGEESVEQIRLRARRLGVENAEVLAAVSTSLSEVLSIISSPNRPDFLIIDSIQTIYHENIESAPGTVTQVRACAHELINACKKRGTVLVLVGHVTKEGQIAGPRVLEHMVDTVLYFEGERGGQYRIVRSIKNRFGGTDEICLLEMTEKGLCEIANPSSIFLNERSSNISGVSVFAAMEGSRPLMVEIQALVVPSFLITPRRAVVGFESARLSMILAVLEARCSVSLSACEVYVSVAGGFKASEPAADLAVAAAIISAVSGEALPEKAIHFGEIGLSGEIRKVSRTDQRIREASKLGFDTAYGPNFSENNSLSKMQYNNLKHLNQLVRNHNIPDLRKKVA